MFGYVNWVQAIYSLFISLDLDKSMYIISVNRKRNIFGMCRKVIIEIVLIAWQSDIRI